MFLLPRKFRSLIAQLRSTRGKRRGDYRRRRQVFESLEDRRMLSLGSTADEPYQTMVVASGGSGGLAELLGAELVVSENRSQGLGLETLEPGVPRGVVRVVDEEVASGWLHHELDIDVVAGREVIAQYRVLVTFLAQNKRDGFQAARKETLVEGVSGSFSATRRVGGSSRSMRPAILPTSSCPSSAKARSIQDGARKRCGWPASTRCSGWRPSARVSTSFSMPSPA
jgi:hypothetical protein